MFRITPKPTPAPTPTCYVTYSIENLGGTETKCYDLTDCPQAYCFNKLNYNGVYCCANYGVPPNPTPVPTPVPTPDPTTSSPTIGPTTQNKPSPASNNDYNYTHHLSGGTLGAIIGIVLLVLCGCLGLMYFHYRIENQRNKQRGNNQIISSQDDSHVQMNPINNQF